MYASTSSGMARTSTIADLQRIERRRPGCDSRRAKRGMAYAVASGLYGSKASAGADQGVEALREGRRTEESVCSGALAPMTLAQVALTDREVPLRQALNREREPVNQNHSIRPGEGKSAEGAHPRASLPLLTLVQNGTPFSKPPIHESSQRTRSRPCARRRRRRARWT